MKRALHHVVSSSAVAVVAAMAVAQDPAPAPIVPPPPITPLPAGSGVEPLPPDAEPPAPEPAPKPTKGKPAPPPPVIRPPGEEGKASTPLPPKAIEVPAAVQKEGDRPSRFYLQTGAGVSIIPDLTLKGFPAADIGGAVEEIGFTGGSLSPDLGVSWSLLVGFRVADRVAIELESGYTTNSVSGFSGTLEEYVGGAPFIPGTFGSTQDGTLSMIPIFANVSWELPLIERRAGRDESGLSLRLAGGFGVTQMELSMQDLVVSAPTAGVDGQTFGIDGTSWQIAGQFRTDLLWNLSSNVDLGVSWRLMYMGAPDFGDVTFEDSANFESSQGLSFGDTWAQSIQGSLNFRF
ncbi:MAG: hypothetical protein QM519_08275 [Bacteroidia bacterium]|nr:hypothetical protein [Bacteroidia bacterium]